jgi:putative NADH-flavin reductase
MRIALLGGSGRIGNHLLTWALQNGHEVTALARNPQSLPPAEGLTVIGGQATDERAVVAAVAAADAVVSALGPRGVKTPALLASAARNIITGMAKTSARRLICVSAAGAFIDGDHDTGAIVKFLFSRVLDTPFHFPDTRQMESVVSVSGLDWTLVRPTRLVNAPATGRYRVRPDYPPPGGRKIARADVARFISTALTDGTWIGERPVLAY